MGLAALAPPYPLPPARSHRAIQTAWLARPPHDVRVAWEARLFGRGQRLRLLDLGREEEVVVLGATTDGSLRVQLLDGTERATGTGELIL